jgi:hypothetical protein
MIDVFAEYGMIGLVGVLFAGQMVFLHKTLMGKIIEIENITIKLIDRFNKSDSDMGRKFDSILDSSSRRHEKLIDELNDVTDKLSEISGVISRMNGSSRN